jgi:Ca-activated chloride channel family protein
MAANTFEVPDASKITPPAAAPGERAGHDIAINLNINAGVPIQSVQSKLHDVLVERNGANTARIRLKDHDKIPNKDFVATWTVAADAVQSGYLTHRQGSEGFVTLMMIPPKRVTPEKLQPKEMIFVIDCSGSQNGRPIQKAKETMNYILDHMNPNDTFQIITFNSGVSQFAEHPEVASSSMRERAHKFVDELQAMGGTWMAPAVEKACSLPNDEHRLRIITFMTDGYVGNDMEILGMIKKYRGQTRWFPFGTGNAVNRFLIDGIAKEGGGEPEYVLLNSSAEEVGKKFYERISSPVLTDIKIEFDGTRVKDVYPKDLVDLWAQKPLYFTGRYTNAGSAKVVLTGYSAGKPYRQEMKLDLPEEQIANEVLPSIWARAKVERLMHEDWKGAQSGHMNPEIKEDIVNTALKYHIMSQYTSFVAVEEDRSTGGAAKKTVPVKVETPDGVNQEPQSYGKLLRRSVRHSASTGSYLGHHLLPLIIQHLLQE